MANRIAALMFVILLGACIPHGERPQAADRSAWQGDGAYRPDERAAPVPPHREDGRENDQVQQLPSAPPAWQARPVTPDAQTINASTYTVRPGDTLRGIADRTGSGSEAIARANALTAPYVIQVGQQLEIPAGRYHLVRSGETGIAIARAYGIDWSRIVATNALNEPYVLRVGMRILIPGGAAGPAGIEERASAFRIDVDDIVTGSSPAIMASARPAQPFTSPRRVLPSTTPFAEPARLNGGFTWPVKGRVVRRFGPGAPGEKNNGIKIAVPIDTPIRAAADGVVAYAGDEIAMLGGLVVLKHGDGWTTVYGHASKLTVVRGQAVKRGQTIAMSGDSGFADRPEVHFEIRQGRTAVNPLLHLPAL